MRYLITSLCISLTFSFSFLCHAQSAGAGAPAAKKYSLIRGGKICAPNGKEWFEGDILIRSSKIAAIGKDIKSLFKPQVIDAKGKYIIPGMVDANSAFLVMPGSRSGAAVSDVLDIFDYFNEEQMAFVLSRGVTSISLTPLPGNGIRGRMSVVKLIPGSDIEGMLLKKDVALKAGLGVNTAGKPITLLNNRNNLEKYFSGAKSYGEAWDKYKEDLEEYLKKIKAGEKKEEAKKPKKPEDKKTGPEKSDNNKKEAEKKKPTPPDPKKRMELRSGAGSEKPPAKKVKKDETPKKPKKPSIVQQHEYLLKAMNGEMAFHIEAHLAADILFSLEIKKKYHIDLVLVGCSEGYLVADEIKESETPVILGPVERLRDGERNEFFLHCAKTAKDFNKIGIPFALAGSGRYPLETRFLSLNAALAAGAGLCPCAAFEAITAKPAKILGVEDRIGTLEKGKDADIVIMSGDPLDSASIVETVLINGDIVYSRGK